MSDNTLNEKIEYGEALFQAIVQQTEEGIYLADLAGRFQFVNEAFCRITGFSEAELMEMNVSDTLPAATGEPPSPVLSAKQSNPLEVEFPKKNGSRVWAKIRTSALLLGNRRFVLGIVRDITKEKQAEATMAESEEKFFKAFQNAPLLMAITAIEDGRFQDVNDAFVSLTGYSRDIALGSTSVELGVASPEDRKKILEILDEEGRVQDLELTIKCADGSEMICLYSAETVDVKGKKRLLATAMDITERKRAEQKYEMLFREMLDGFALHEIICNSEGQPEDYRFLAVNPAFENMTGLKADQIVNRTVREVLPGIEEHWIETYGNVAITGEPAYFEDYATALDKHFQVMAFRSAPGQFASIFADITERKRAELELRESEAKFRSFTEQSFVGFYIIQDDFLKYVNPRFADMFGYSVEECLDGMRFRELVHPEDLAVVEDQVRRRISGEMETVQHTFRCIKKTGEIIHVSVYGSSLTYQGIPAAIGTVLDITKETEMEKRVAQSQRMEAIGSLAGGIAHDFNNILFPILGLSEMLLEDLSPGTPEYEKVEQILVAGTRGSDLVQQILAFSRQSEQKKMPIRLQQILKEVMKLTRSTIPTYISITDEIQNDCGLVMAEPTHLHQIFMNLITNAYHAVEPRSGEIAVRLREVAIGTDEGLSNGNLIPGRYALVSVSDTGNGIDPAIMDKIFEPYFTTKKQDKGTGLGLAVVYGIVKEHLGDIEVRSTPGSGTTFRIYLPIITKTERQVVHQEKTDYASRNERILLLDDEQSIVNVEKQVLERLGYRVSAYTDSAIAFEAFEANPSAFDLVISDISMPNMTGDQLAGKIIMIRPDIPIILCTGFSERLSRREADEIGIKGFLMKPIKKSEIAEMVRRVLDASGGTAR